jgi:hypothetical protein
MARNSDQFFETENPGGLLSGFLAEEDEFDRRTLWRLGSWAVVSVGAVIVALYANQSSIGLRREQVAAADLARQSQQIQLLARESQSEARRLASAIDTLSGDRDRLYSRVTVLEQGLDSVTGSIAKQSAAATPPPAAAAASAEAQNPPPAPAVPPVTTTAAATAAPAADKPQAAATGETGPATSASVAQAASDPPAATPSTPLMPSKSIMAPPDPAAGKLIESNLPPKPFTSAPMPDVVASAPPADDAEPDVSEALPVAVRQTEFAIDLGGANSLPGLRTLWRGLLKSNPALAALRPRIAVKEGRNGLGMQLRLVAGPLRDAATAAKICAALVESKRSCATAEFDGQRLAMNAGDPLAQARPVVRKRSVAKHTAGEEPAKKPETSTLSSIFSRR